MLHPNHSLVTVRRLPQVFDGTDLEVWQSLGRETPAGERLGLRAVCATLVPLPLPFWSTSETLCAAAGTAMPSASIDAPVKIAFFIVLAFWKLGSWIGMKRPRKGWRDAYETRPASMRLTVSSERQRQSCCCRSDQRSKDCQFRLERRLHSSPSRSEGCSFRC